MALLPPTVLTMTLFRECLTRTERGRTLCLGSQAAARGSPPSLQAAKVPAPPFVNERPPLTVPMSDPAITSVIERR
jgi:hypothetical protein